jgi:hypothetical protein
MRAAWSRRAFLRWDIPLCVPAGIALAGDGETGDWITTLKMRFQSLTHVQPPVGCQSHVISPGSLDDDALIC